MMSRNIEEIVPTKLIPPEPVQHLEVPIAIHIISIFAIVICLITCVVSVNMIFKKKKIILNIVSIIISIGTAYFMNWSRQGLLFSNETELRNYIIETIIMFFIVVIIVIVQILRYFKIRKKIIE